MVQSVTFSQFVDAFERMDRRDQFSYRGLEALYDYLEEYDPDFDLDVIGICCEFTEYMDFEALRQDYPDIEDMSGLKEETIVVSESPLIIQNF